MDKVSTGISGLDDILLGGLQANHLYLVEGDPGSGKTTLGLHFLRAGADKGEVGLYITLAESSAELRLIAASHDISMDGILVHEYLPAEETLSAGNEYSALYPTEVELHDTMQAILAKVKELRPARVVFDSLSEVRILARELFRYRRQILALKQFFFKYESTVLMLDARSTEDSELQLQSIAHGVFLLDRIERDFGAERRRLRVAKLRGAAYREGYHDYVIRRGGLQLFPRIVADSKHPQIPGRYVQSGMPTLDSLTGGGLPFGTSTIVKGPAGTGKSTIVTQYLFNAAKSGTKVAMFQLDESIGTTIARSKALGMDLEPLIASGVFQLTQFDPAEVSPGEFVALVRTAVEDGAQIVTIDTLNGFLNVLDGEERLLLQMHELCMYMNQKDVLVFLVLSQSGVVGSSTANGLELSYLADNVMIFAYFEAFGEVRRAISVLKMRMNWHEASIRELRFDKNSFAIGESLRNFSGILSGIPQLVGSSAQLERGMGDNGAAS